MCACACVCACFIETCVPTQVKHPTSAPTYNKLPDCIWILIDPASSISQPNPTPLLSHLIPPTPIPIRKVSTPHLRCQAPCSSTTTTTTTRPAATPSHDPCINSSRIKSSRPISISRRSSRCIKVGSRAGCLLPSCLVSLSLSVSRKQCVCMFYYFRCCFRSSASSRFLTTFMANTYSMLMYK